MPVQLSRTIVSLALLNTNFNRFQRDYLDCFVPFVAEALRVLNAEVVSDAELRGALMELFGLAFPQSAVRSLLNRAKTEDLVRVEYGAFHPKQDEIRGPPLSGCPGSSH